MLDQYTKSFKEWLSQEVDLLAFLDKEIPGLDFLDIEIKSKKLF